MSELKVTTVEEIKELAGGEIVSLPGFKPGKPFVARLKKPSLLKMVKDGQIPNSLLGVAKDMFEGNSNESDLADDPEAFKQSIELFYCVAAASLVEPAYEDVEEYINDDQVIAIFNYTQSGIDALKPFREEQGEDVEPDSNS